MAILTDCRDSGKLAYQQYAVVSDFNAYKLPDHLSAKEAAPLGIAFVAAALALGICIGLDVRNANGGVKGPDLFRIIRKLSRESMAEDVRPECFDGITNGERHQAGDWLAIWGGKTIMTLCLKGRELKCIRKFCHGLHCRTAS